jgi:hypothetical protein
MESVKAEAVAGEGKAVTSFRSQVREQVKAAACLEALIRQAEKPLVGEPRGGTSGALNCRAQLSALSTRRLLPDRLVGLLPSRHLFRSALRCHLRVLAALHTGFDVGSESQRGMSS